MNRLLDDRALAKALGVASQQRSRRYDAETGLRSWCQLLSSPSDPAPEPSCQPVSLDV